jgi:hypothetical protein
LKHQEILLGDNAQTAIWIWTYPIKGWQW